MPRGKILTGKEDKIDDFRLVDDFKLRLTLSAIADQISEQERMFVYEYYSSPQVIKLYSDIRKSGIYQSGSKDKSRRKILDLPPKIMDFLDVVMGNLYGQDWLSNRRALNHELVRPFLLVERL
jgi:hypothetical protein